MQQSMKIDTDYYLHKVNKIILSEVYLLILLSLEPKKELAVPWVDLNLSLFTILISSISYFS